MEDNIDKQLDPIFNARAVAVIGASNNPTKWGHSLMERPQKAGYQSALYPVNPNEREVLGLKAYPTILDVPGEVDLAVFTIPARLIPQAVRECIQKGVKGGVVISAGFAETGPGGQL